MKELLYLNKYLLKYKWHFLFGILFVVGSNYFGVLIPQEIREALDFVNNEIQKYKGLDPTQKSSEYSILSRVLMTFSLTVVGYALLKGFFMFMMRQTIIVMSRLIEYDLRKDLFHKLLTLDTKFFKINKTGDIMARMSEDISKVRMYLGPALLYGINIVALFTFTIYTMFSVNAELSFYALLPLPFLSISIFLVSKMINKRSTVIQAQLSKLTSISQETYSGIRVVKSYAKEDSFVKYFAEECDDYKEKSLDLARINAYFFPFMIFFISLSTLIVIYVGGLKVEAGTISPGNIAEFIIYVNMLTWPVTSIGWIASLVQQAAASQERLNYLFNQTSEIKEGNPHTNFGNGDIVFENVSFSYPETGIKALDDVSFRIKVGERVAVIGRTASGKSTIAELLLRMYDPDQGRITINGEDIKSFSFEELRSLVGYVPQDVFLFSDTISQNIALGANQNIEASRIAQYAQYAGIRDEINDLDDGFETKIGERGVTLSGGQKQRVSIARALATESKIIILDDSLSAVDPSTEQKILNYLDSELEGKTSIIITHRVTTLDNLDKVLVLEDGKIVENGSPDSLIKDEDGYYFKMVQQLNARYEN